MKPSRSFRKKFNKPTRDAEAEAATRMDVDEFPPLGQAPAKQAPAKQAPVKQAPAKQAPAEQVPEKHPKPKDLPQAIKKQKDSSQVAKKEAPPNNMANNNHNNGHQRLSKKDRKASKRAKQAKKAQNLSDPKKIMDNILAKTSFKEAKLSRLIDEKFYKDPVFVEELKKELSDVKYEATVGETVDGFSDVPISVLPAGLEGIVNISPLAITTLPCINAPVGKRWRKFRKGKGKKKPKLGNNNNRNSQQQQPKTDTKVKQQHD